MRPIRMVVATLTLVVWIAPAADARQTRATPSTYLSRLRSLKPGDTLVLSPGEYRKGLRIRGLHGTSRRPITIIGYGAKTVLVARPNANTCDLTDASHIVIRNLTFDGRNVAVDAIKAGGDDTRGVHHITIEGNTIINHGKHQNIVGISTKVPCWDWTIRGNTITGAGTGLYLGNSDGRQPFIRGVIEYNLVRDPVGYCMQVKRQIDRPQVPEIPTESCSTLIRYNVFVKNNRKGDAGDRPNLLVGGFPDGGPGSGDRYQIYGNLFHHNPRESLFQGTGNLSLHDNIFLDAEGTAVRIMPHHGKPPRHVRVYHNTFLQVGKPISISGLARDGSRTVLANLVIQPRAGRGNHPGCLVLAGSQASGMIAGPVLDFKRLDLQPRKLASMKGAAGLAALVKADVDHDRDYYGEKKRTMAHCGAIGRVYRKARRITLDIRKPRE